MNGKRKPYDKGRHSGRKDKVRANTDPAAHKESTDKEARTRPDNDSSSQNKPKRRNGGRHHNRPRQKPKAEN